MQNFLKVIVVLAVIGIVVVSALFVLDVAVAEEVKDTLQKTLLILAIVALGGLAVGWISRTR